ncbi:DUF4190 domain-containing protein [Georgenia alba]|uniref:DUF4190 domain-containing protein n=1 Tax=Georgenia alba TaxID=2233858 RepID=A0ABW2Q4M5_9MICO
MDTRAAGQGPEPENPFAAPSGPRRATPAPSPYGDYGASATYDHASPADAERLGLPTTGVSAQREEPLVFPGTEAALATTSFADEGYTAPEPVNHPLAVAAVILGVLALLPGVGLAAVVCGHLALHRMTDGYWGGRGLAITGLVLGYTLTVMWALLALALWAGT